MLLGTQAGAASPVVEYLKISTDINSGYANTTVEEKLYNPANSPVEDSFSFLIPEEAFISGFSLTIDGKEYIAEVLERESASQRFNVAASEGRTAGLLETKEKNLFSYALSFEPGQSIIVKLTYEQALKKTLGEYELVQFLNNGKSAGNLSVTININSENQLTRLEVPDFPADEVTYLSANSGQVRYDTSSLPPSELRVLFETENPPVNGNMLFYENGNEGYFMHIFSPSEADLGTSAMDKEIIFVLDRSGSMEGYKIEQVKEVFGNIIEDLPPGDYFNIISFDSTVVSYSETLAEANQEEKAKALDFVNRLEPDGGTNINEALLIALGMFNPESKRVPIIVFLTDGEPTVGVISPYAIRQNIKNANTAQVSIFSIAFGIESESNYHFLRAMSLENYGTAEWFSPEANAAEEIGSFYETISTPLIKDMVFSYGGDTSETVSTGEKNLFAGSDTIVLGKYSPGAGSIRADISASIRTGNRDFSKEFSITSKAANSFIPRLWAYTTINSLLDRIEVEGENEGLVSEVTELALEFGFVTPYTSLFVELPGTTNLEPAGDLIGENEEEKPTMFSSSAGQPKSTVTSTYDRNAIYEEELAEESVEEAATPGFEVFLALSGILGTAFFFRKNFRKK